MSSSLILCNNNEPFLNWWLFATKSGLLCDNQLSEWTVKRLQRTSQCQTCTKKRKVIVTGGLLPVWSTTALWILVKPLHRKSMLSKLMRCTKTCNACSRHWSTERAPFSTMPNCTLHNQHSKSWTNRLQSIASSAIFTWPLSNRLPLLQASQQLFAGKMLPQPPGGRKCFLRVHWIPRHVFSSYRHK